MTMLRMKAARQNDQRGRGDLHEGPDRRARVPASIIRGHVPRSYVSFRRRLPTVSPRACRRPRPSNRSSPPTAGGSHHARGRPMHHRAPRPGTGSRSSSHWRSTSPPAGFNGGTKERCECHGANAAPMRSASRDPDRILACGARVAPADPPADGAEVVAPLPTSADRCEAGGRSSAERVAALARARFRRGAHACHPPASGRGRSSRNGW